MTPDVRSRSIAVVTPWFGKELTGGAERQAWQIAVRLAALGINVDVLTTCCKAFSEDWATNSLPSGVRLESGVTIRRFPVDLRNRNLFDGLNLELLALDRRHLLPGVSPVPAERANIWTDENINSSALEEYLRKFGQRYDRLIFIPYLYGVTLRGLPLLADRAWLQPCLHDEVYAYLPDVGAIFRAAAGLLFNSAGEMELAAKLFGPLVLAKGHVVGEGVELDLRRLSKEELDLPNDLRSGRFVLCLGRRSPEKGTDRLTSAFAQFRRRNRFSDLSLALAGPGTACYSNPDLGIVDLGLVSERKKLALLRSCRALLQPSTNESFSRVLFEAWMCGKPAVVHAECLATSSAVTDAQGGWTAGPAEEWLARLEHLDSCPAPQLRAVGEQGRRYAREWADWNSVMDRYVELLQLRAAASAGSTPARRMQAVHQLLPNLSFGDAISNQAIWIRENLLRAGYRSDIYVRYIDDRVRAYCRPYEPGLLTPEDGLIYHHSIGSEITPVACTHPGPKWLLYHNITPAEFFQAYDSNHARLLRNGREEMWTLARVFPRSVGVSRYNAEELEMYGFSNPQTLPLAVDPRSWSMPPDEALMRRLQDGRRNLLYVGRLAPNKCQHELVEAFAHYLLHDSEARLTLVGSGSPTEPYVKLVYEMVHKYALEQQVSLAGHVNSGELHAYYRTAHLFWSMSEHEGFCAPLIEAMWFDVPVLAFRAAAAGETLGDAGVTFADKENLGEIASLAARIVSSKATNVSVLGKQRKRRHAFEPKVVERRLFEIISSA
jgi:glycosyltransferase involved in cell wall biosynthesis